MIWVDAHLSPAVAEWMASELNQPAQPIGTLGLRNAKDPEISG